MANAIKPITYSLAKGEFKAPVVFNTEHLTIRLIIDFTDQGVDVWEKFVDIRTAAGSERTLSLGTGIIVEELLESGDLESGITIIQPFAIGTPYARRDWPQRPITVGPALGNTVNNTALKQDLIDFFQHYLTDMDASNQIKAVNVTTLAPNEPSNFEFIREQDGTTINVGLTKGDTGLQGIQGVKGDKGDTGNQGIQGIQGIQGNQGIQGLKGNQWRGAYSGATAYVVDDVVSYLGSSYICILASTNNLPTNTTFWQLFATTGTAIASNVTNTPSGGIVATTVQSAINELDTEKANKVQEAWIYPTLINGAVTYADNPVRFRKDEFGYVHVEGGLTGNAALISFTLPTGYRPTHKLIRNSITSGYVVTNFTLQTGGSVYVNGYLYVVYEGV